MKPKTVTIVGLGLMGASLGLALRKYARGIRVLGVSRSRQKVREARRIRAIHGGSTSLAAGVRNSDLIVICTPVSRIPNLVSAIDRLTRPGTVVTDVGSTKEEIIRSVRKLRLRNVVFVGSHPMAGSHEWGIRFARADLYRGALVFVIGRGDQNRRAALSMVRALWTSVGAKVHSVDAREHDRIAACVSQVPHLLAAELVNVTPKHILPFAASGFRDATRIAQGHPELWLDIVRTNSKEIARQLSRFSAELDHFIRDVKARSARKVFGRLARASRTRRNLRTISA